MRNFFLILIGRVTSRILRTFNLGNGSTWPGHIALKANPHFISDLLKNSSMKIILVAGTNGKTTTSSLIQHILEKDGKKVLLNNSGANLLNGIASTLLLNATPKGNLPYDVAIFEVDENALPLLLKELTPNYLVLLNLFRDQLDRYGEVHSIADKWEESIKRLSSNSSLAPDGEREGVRGVSLVLNADDPEIAWLGLNQNLKSVIPGGKPGIYIEKNMDSRIREDDNILYFGLNNKSLSKQTRDHAVDSVYCPRCNFPLEYKTNYYSHLGDWYCPDCRLERPKLSPTQIDHYPLSGTYNLYNTNAAVLVAKQIGIDDRAIDTALRNFKPAFGRQETIEVKGRKIQIFLSKNPTSFNQSLQTIHTIGGKNLLIALNDRVADGHDVSWIWDTDLEQYLSQFESITLAGDRCYDLGLRLKYSQDEFKIQNSKFKVEPKLTTAINSSLEKTKDDETLYILPTYTAMLEVRKIITGKKIL